MKQLMAIVVFASCFCTNAFSQIKTDTEVKPKLYKHALLYNPLNIFIGRIKVDYENFSLLGSYTLGGSVTLGSTTRNVDQDGLEIKVEKSVFGIEINNKLYLTPLSNRETSNLNLYLNLAPMYQRLEFEYLTDVWDMYSKDGILVYELNEQKKVRPASNRIGLNPQMGFLYNNNKLAVDFYVGVSVHKDYIQGETGTVELPLNTIPESSTNSSPVGGVKMGIFF